MTVFLPDRMGDPAAVHPASFYAPADEPPDPADLHSNLFPRDEEEQ